MRFITIHIGTLPIEAELWEGKHALDAAHIAWDNFLAEADPHKEQIIREKHRLLVIQIDRTGRPTNTSVFKPHQPRWVMEEVES